MVTFNQSGLSKCIVNADIINLVEFRKIGKPVVMILDLKEMFLLRTFSTWFYYVSVKDMSVYAIECIRGLIYIL